MPVANVVGNTMASPAAQSETGIKPKVTVTAVTQKFRVRENGRVQDFTAVDDFNLTVSEGEFLTLVGSSGCGKSTVLDILAGLVKPRAGKAYIGAREIKGTSFDTGIVMQGYALFPWRNVRDNVAFGLEIKGICKKERLAVADRFLELVGLTKFANRHPHELSGGMKQRVAIARALAYDPEVLLMDEPFAAVDAQTRETLQDELLRIWDATKKTIIFVTHSIDEAVFLADRVVVLASHPGCVKEIIPVNIPRPRSNADIRLSAEFNWIRQRVYEALMAPKCISNDSNDEEQL
jgi:NitT/TauT family transport system ATP-binding protein